MSFSCPHCNTAYCILSRQLPFDRSIGNEIRLQYLYTTGGFLQNT
ncbi:hypothetical protein KBC79_01570 [Candidatus Woesebacteria bacterium]|nr:hypothetical protein [Candidatus Woesebacteria bacterium]